MGMCFEQDSAPVCFYVGIYRCYVWLVEKFGGLCIGLCLASFLQEEKI